MNKYGAILADPPWSWKAWSKKGDGRSALNHYSTMPLADIALLPVYKHAAPDCALFLWCIDSMLPQALTVMGQWGFTYKTVAFTWVKLTKDGERWPIGMGYWTRGNPEMCLLGTRGKPERLDKGVRQLIQAPRREHSRKPAEVHKRITKLVPGPYLELFARESRDGWDTVGDERTKFDIGKVQ